MNKIWKIIDHNRYLVIAGALIAALVVYSGCASRTLSIVTPKADAGILVTRVELQREVTDIRSAAEAAEKRLEVAVADLDMQDEQRRQILGTVGTLVNMAVPAAAPLAGPVLGSMGVLLGLGAGGDNLRKNRVIKDLKAEKKA